MAEQDTPKEIAKNFAKNMQCNCDLDNWEPERSPYTGHSWVCRIHKATVSLLRAASTPVKENS